MAQVKQQLQDLETEIHRLYGRLGPHEVDQIAQFYDDSITEMFEVNSKGAEALSLTHLFNDDIFAPVVVPRSLHRLIRRKQVFLMTLGYRNGQWHLLCSSSPHQEFWI